MKAQAAECHMLLNLSTYIARKHIHKMPLGDRLLRSAEAFESWCKTCREARALDGRAIPKVIGHVQGAYFRRDRGGHPSTTQTSLLWASNHQDPWGTKGEGRGGRDGGLRG